MNKILALALLIPASLLAAEGDVPIEQSNGRITTQTISGDVTVTAAGVAALSAGSVGDSEMDYTEVTLSDFVSDLPVNTSIKTAATYTVGTDDANESYGTLFLNGDNDAIDFTLPSAVAGMSACFVQGQGVAGAITVQPNTGDYLVVDGVRGTIATDYTSGGEGADKLCVIAADATDWIVTSEIGTWAE